ncbi:hypothetical protein D9M70_402500 [compost metagenome]
MGSNRGKMTAENFVYWLQGFAELNGQAPNEAQWQSIREHLGLVLKKVTEPVYRGEPGFVTDAGTVSRTLDLRPGDNASDLLNRAICSAQGLKAEHAECPALRVTPTSRVEGIGLTLADDNGVVRVKASDLRLTC